MPDISIDLLGDASLIEQESLAIIENGYLFGLTAWIVGGVTAPGRTRVTAGVWTGASAEPLIVCTLIDDYIYPGYTPSWDGRFPLETSSGLFLTLLTADTPTVRLTGRALKNDP